MDEILKKYVHQNWDDVPKCRSDKYYFCKIDDRLEKDFAEVQYQLETDVPGELKLFWQNIGSVSFGLISNKRKDFTGCFHQKKF